MKEMIGVGAGAIAAGIGSEEIDSWEDYVGFGESISGVGEG